MGYIQELRALIGSIPIIMAGVSVIVLNEKNQILLQRRSDTGDWGVIGGALELGETLEEAAERELYEEAGLRAKELKFMCMLSGKDMYYQYPHGDEIFNLVAVFETRDYYGKPTINDDEGLELKYFDLDKPIEELNEMAIKILIKANYIDEQLNKAYRMNNGTASRKNMIGGSETNATSVDMDKRIIHETNSLFWDTKGNEVLGATALPFYGAFVSEENCQLFGDISGKKILEIGCGSGQSLQYLGERKAGDLWGIDLSEKQIEKTKRHLKTHDISAKLICSPMEDECGIPKNYFDIVYSIYALGWTTDLEGTFNRIYSYLNTGGVFIFSWSHPIHKCVSVENDQLIFKKCYFDESWYSVTLDESTLSLSDRKLSTYINALAQTGFVIEQLVEESDDEMMRSHHSIFADKAKMLPVTFIIKARKL